MSLHIPRHKGRRSFFDEDLNLPISIKIIHIPNTSRNKIFFKNLKLKYLFCINNIPMSYLN